MAKLARAALLVPLAIGGLTSPGRPFDTTYPTAVEIRSAADTGDGRLLPGETVLVPVTQLAVLFSEPMLDPEGDTQVGDLTNPDNWLLVNAGPDQTLQTSSCATGVDPADVSVALAGVTSWPALDAGVVDPEGSSPLPRGRYRLLACATLSDLDGNPLDGNGDGSGGDDLLVDFAVAAQELLSNPGFDAGLDRWTPG